MGEVLYYCMVILCSFAVLDNFHLGNFFMVMYGSIFL